MVLGQAFLRQAVCSNLFYEAEVAAKVADDHIGCFLPEMCCTFPWRTMMISVMPRASATGVSCWPLPGNLKVSLEVTTSGKPVKRRPQIMRGFDCPVMASMASQTLTLGGPSAVLRICRTDCSLRVEKLDMLAMRSGFGF